MRPTFTPSDRQNELEELWSKQGPKESFRSFSTRDTSAFDMGRAQTIKKSLLEFNLKLDELNEIWRPLPASFQELKDIVWQTASVHVPHKIRYSISKYEIEFRFFDPEQGIEYPISNDDEFIQIVTYLNNLRYFQNYWCHEIWCTLSGLPLPLEKISTKKWGRKKK